MVHHSPIPDTLYMVDPVVYSPQLHHHGNTAASSTATVDVIAGTIPGEGGVN